MATLYGDPTNLQGGNVSLQGSMPALQGSTPVLQGSSPTLQGTPPTQSPQTIITPKVSYNDLSLKDLNGNPTVINTKTGFAYSTPLQLAQDLGVSPDQIQWGQIAKAPTPVVTTPYRQTQVSSQPTGQPVQGQTQNTQLASPGISQPQTTNPFVLSQLMSALEGQVKTNNSLMDTRNLFLKQLYDQPLTPEERAKIDPALLKTLDSGDRSQIDMQLRLISDQVQGRVGTLDQSVQYLTKAYNDSITQAETQKQNAIGNVLDFVKTYGSNAKQALISLYGQQYIDQLKSMGIDIDRFANVATLAQQQSGISPTALTGNQVGNISGLPSYDTAAANPGMNRPNRNNNPGNIKVSAWSKNLPGVIGVESRPATDGGHFLIFDSPQSGMNAIGMLLQQDSNYQNVTAEQAMKKYSGGGYGASAVGLDPTKDFQSQIADSGTLDSVVAAIAKREGFTGGGGTVGQPTIGQDAIDLAAQQYLATGQMPALGLGSNPGVVATRSAILNRAAELAQGSIPGVNKAILSAQTSALKQQTQYANTIERSINTVDANIQILESAASKVSDYNSPLLNEWQRLLQRKVIGSGDLAAYTTALQTVRTEYATILGRGTATDQTRLEAARLIPDNLSKAQLDQVIATIRQEGQNVLQNAYSQVSSLQDQMNGLLTGGSTGNLPVLSAPQNASDPLGIL
jgi:hypothetical protein